MLPGYGCTAVLARLQHPSKNQEADDRGMLKASFSIGRGKCHLQVQDDAGNYLEEIDLTAPVC